MPTVSWEEALKSFLLHYKGSNRAPKRVEFCRKQLDLLAVLTAYYHKAANPADQTLLSTITVIVGMPSGLLLRGTCPVRQAIVQSVK